METDCGKLIQKAQINNRSKVLGLSEQALKGQEKRKAEADGNGEKTSGRVGRQKRLNQPTTAKPTPT